MSESSPITASVIVGTTATLLAVGATSRPGRKRLYVFNASNATVYVGPASVTTANGRPLPPNDEIVWESDEDLYGIAAASGKDVRVTETI